MVLLLLEVTLTSHDVMHNMTQVHDWSHFPQDA